MDPFDADPWLLSAKEVGKRLGCSARTVHRRAREGLIPPPVHLGSLARWPRIQLEGWVASGCPDVRDWLGGETPEEANKRRARMREWLAGGSNA